MLTTSEQSVLTVNMDRQMLAFKNEPGTFQSGDWHCSPLMLVPRLTSLQTEFTECKWEKNGWRVCLTNEHINPLDLLRPSAVMTNRNKYAELQQKTGFCAMI